MIVRADHLTKIYNEETGIRVIDDISFEVGKGEFLGIMGRSGCGKTTLLKMIGLIEPLSAGRFEILDRNVSSLSSAERSEIRRLHMGFVFQDFQLINALTARENILLPCMLNKSGINNDMVDMIADALKIGDLLERCPDGFSGGEKQRVAICRAIINEPEIILADEPTGNLDSKSGKQVVRILEEINRVLGKTIIMVTHDPVVASSCQRIMFLKDGKIVNEIAKSEENTAQSYLRSIIRISNSDT